MENGDEETPNIDGVDRGRVEAWVSELESGRHRQTCGRLQARDHNQEAIGHCALGVAMLVAERAGVRVEPLDWGIGCLPETVRDWYGFAEEDVFLKFEGGVVAVPELNDNLSDEVEGWLVPENKSNFWEIAQAIRATYLKDEGS